MINNCTKRCSIPWVITKTQIKTRVHFTLTILANILDCLMPSTICIKKQHKFSPCCSHHLGKKFLSKSERVRNLPLSSLSIIYSKRLHIYKKITFRSSVHKKNWNNPTAHQLKNYETIIVIIHPYKRTLLFIVRLYKGISKTQCLSIKANHERLYIE